MGKRGLIVWDAGMTAAELIPIRHLREYDHQGERRWTGLLLLPGHTPRAVLVLKVRGQLLCIREACPHRGNSLKCGRLNPEANIIECPSHGWELCLDGEDLAPLPVVETADGMAVDLMERRGAA